MQFGLKLDKLGVMLVLTLSQNMHHRSNPNRHVIGLSKKTMTE